MARSILLVVSLIRRVNKIFLLLAFVAAAVFVCAYASAKKEKKIQRSLVALLKLPYLFSTDFYGDLRRGGGNVQNQPRFYACPRKKKIHFHLFYFHVLHHHSFFIICEKRTKGNCRSYVFERFLVRSQVQQCQKNNDNNGLTVCITSVNQKLGRIKATKGREKIQVDKLSSLSLLVSIIFLLVVRKTTGNSRVFVFAFR